MKNDKWVRQWVVPSSSNHGNYIVSQDKDGNYACGCRGWTMNVRKCCPDCGLQLTRGNKPLWCFKCRKTVENPRTERIECSHITTVKYGGGKSIAEATIDRLAGR